MLVAASAVVGGLGWSAASMGAAIPFRSSTFTLNHSTFKDQARGDKPRITGGVLTITNGGPSDANSSFYTTPLSVGGPFTASFVYQAVNPTGGGSGAA